MANFIDNPEWSVSYDLVHGVEFLLLYTQGGFHPIQVGEFLKGDRYKILNKLDYGAFSTTWLAMDTSQNRLVALKILRADVSAAGMETKLIGALETLPDRHLFALPESCFKIKGPNGIHDATVLPVTGPSLSRYMENQGGKCLPVKARNKAIREIIQGLKSLHESGIGHGDLNTSDILLRLPESYLKNQEELLASFGEPSFEEIRRLDGKPLTANAPELIFFPARFTFPEQLDGTIMIAEFLLAFKPPVEGGIATFCFYTPNAAPERLLGETFGFPSDIWSLACVVFELISSKKLFLDSSESPDMVFYEIMEVLGKQSEEWWLGREKAMASLKISRRDVAMYNVGPARLDDLIEELDDETIDKDLLKDFLKQLLALDPERRPSIHEVQEHAFVKSLA